LPGQPLKKPSMFDTARNAVVTFLVSYFRYIRLGDVAKPPQVEGIHYEERTRTPYPLQEPEREDLPPVNQV
jgi:hypothetical protein